MRKVAFSLFLLVLALTSTGLGFQKLETLNDQRAHTRSIDLEQRRDSLYLPQISAVKVASLGYEHALAHVLWFNTINYFGKNYREGKNYRWLSHMCTLVSTLLPRAEHVYRFCGTMLAWEGNLPTESIAILDRAISQFPEDWYFYYLRGFTKVYFLGDESGGGADIIKAGSFPDAHNMIKRIAAKKLTTDSGPESAIRFLEDAIRVTDEPNAKKALIDRLKESYYERDLRALEQAVKEFNAKNGRFPQNTDELVTHKLVPEFLIAHHFRDPYGGVYEIDPNNGTVQSTSKKPRPKLRWNRPPALEQTS